MTTVVCLMLQHKEKCMYFIVGPSKSFIDEFLVVISCFVYILFY